ncbi:hypothetical protein MPL3356_340116 [Mesorhizobium plurifarium]|uniref:Uncharacterized protein n=1 Tax=Mesorhizobium plurifarium TaxID=69974 RepID=A0A090E2E8_MESPL|nr:hypothetical protein MPL3356_340116 [Mesorhizobium plurifarium]
MPDRPCGRTSLYNSTLNSHGTGIERELCYPWHPWDGLQVHTHEIIENGDVRFSAAAFPAKRRTGGWRFRRGFSTDQLA